MESGVTVLLDRYWWSTYTYGLDGGLASSIVTDMIAIEEAYWGDLVPAMAFLLLPPRPYRPEIDQATYERLSALYRNVARGAPFPVHIMDESLSLQDATVHVHNRIQTPPNIGLGES